MIICFIVSTFYSRFGPTWERPIINGLVTMAVVASLFLSLRAVLTLPSARLRTTPKNVGAKVLGWLHNFNLIVQTFPEDSDCHFFIVVTTEAGKKVAIYRKKEVLSDYLTFQSTVTQNEETKKAVEGFSDEEKMEVILYLKLELARAVIGYQSTNMLEGYTMFKKLPITESLTEAQVINTVWEMESMVARMNTIEHMASLKHQASATSRRKE